MVDESQVIERLRERIGTFPHQLIILGTGWNEVLTEIKTETEIPYTDLFGVATTVPGHAGKLVVGSLDGKRVALMVGRFHMYEGFSAMEATLPIRVFGAVGVDTLVVTSASGAINEKYQVGDLIILSDLITLFMSPDSPLRGPQFTDLSEVFDLGLRQAAIKACVERQMPFHEGIYAYLHGPQFETPADKMALKIVGTDVVGMSTVPETMAARFLGIKVAGLSVVTNLAFVKHRHEEVVAAAESRKDDLAYVIKKLILEEL